MKKLILISALLFSFNGWAETYDDCKVRAHKSTTSEDFKNTLAECEKIRPPSNNPPPEKLSAIDLKRWSNFCPERFAVRIAFMNYVCDFSGYDLTGMSLVGYGNVGGIQKAKEKAKFVNSILDETTFTFRDTDGTIFSSNLQKTNFQGASLIKADLERANLERANLDKANLSQANLSLAKLYYASLKGANLTNANVANANFFRADLTNSVFMNTIIEEADFRGANLEGADLSFSDFSEAKLQGANLSNVKYCQTIMRSGIRNDSC